MMEEKKHPEPCISFDDAYPTIKIELAKKKNKWTLTSLSYIDYQDICQIITFHIWKKLYQYNCNMPLAPWLSRIISNQISNLIRNHYSNHNKPCTKCEAAEGADGCKIHTIQCSKCPLYADWEKRKQPAQNIKMAVPIENHINEIHDIPENQSEINDSVHAVHVKMKEVLRPMEYKVYEGLFILNEDESVVAKRVGFFTNEKGREPGYKQMKNIVKIIIEKVRKYVKSEEIDFN